MQASVPSTLSMLAVAAVRIDDNEVMGGSDRIKFGHGLLDLRVVVIAMEIEDESVWRGVSVIPREVD